MAVLFILRMTYRDGGLDMELSAEHRKWVEATYRLGLFLASGPSKGGGFALATGCQRDQLEAYVKTDPVIVSQRGDYQIAECEVSLSAPGFDDLLQDRIDTYRRAGSGAGPDRTASQDESGPPGLGS